MALLIGQAMHGRDLEQATSPWPPERFAAMCDALAWAASGRQCPSLPSFTAQVNAKDGGIDAEWSVELPDDGHPVPTPLLGPGWNVFQYKKRDLIAQDRRRILAHLRSSLTGAVRDIVNKDKAKRHPDRYVLFVNVDLKGSDKLALQESILKGYSDPSKVHVHIVGAGELAAFLNNHPHLRAAYFTPLLFKTWEEAHRAHLNQKLIGTDVELIGREEERSRLTALVDDPRVRVIVLSGPHDIGKSRLALEATQHRPHDVVQALDPRSMDLSDYRSLCTSHGETICLVEDPEPDAIERLVNEALSISNFKLIIALPTPINAPAPSYGHDERVQTLHLQSLADAEARKLLTATGQPLDREITEWIVQHAGGIPGVLLAAASVGNTLRQDLTSFVEAVGRAFEHRIREELGAEALTCTRLFSVLTYVGIAGDVATELRYICDVFSEGWTPNRALIALKELERAGLARRGGSFGEITLPLLANYLVSQLLQGRRLEMLALFGRLDNRGQVRFITRLSEVRSEEVERFWNELFASDGLLKDFQAARSHLHVLRLLAGTVPDRVLRLLESGLQNSSMEERLAIQGEQRRDLVRTLEQLLFRVRTSRGAMRLLWLLAEAENEHYGSNATGILKGCFHPFHPQMPLPLQERIALLHEFTSEKASKTGKVIAIKAVEGVLSSITLSASHGLGLEPLDVRPPFTYGDLYDYAGGLVDSLMSLAQKEDEVASAALGVLPTLTARLGAQACPKEAVEHLRMLVDWACTGKSGLNVSSLLRALHYMHAALSRALSKADLLSEQRDEFLRCCAELEHLQANLDLEGAAFAARLKRWIGESPASGGRQRIESERQKLADEAVRHPQLLSTDLMAWMLSSPTRQASDFFLFLGCSDADLVHQQRIEELGQQPDGIGAFVQYWSGWAQRDREAAERRLDQLAEAQAVSGEAIVMATAQLGATWSAVNRIQNQVQAGRVDPAYAASVLRVGRWMEGLTEEQFVQLLEVIIGENMEYAAAAVGMLRAWMSRGHSLQGILADFAWECLEHKPPVASFEYSWNFDQLAAKLSQDSPERGFRLLERLVQQSARDTDRWGPLAVSDEEENQFWTVLYATDSIRLLGILLHAAQTNVSMRDYLTWGLHELLDQEGDRGLLLALAGDNIQSARIIAGWITNAKPGFWPIVFELVQQYPHDEELLSNLTVGLEQLGTVIEGPRSRFCKALQQEVEQRLHAPDTPSAVRAWLREVMGRLEREIPQQIIWEYDLNVDDLRAHIRDQHSSQRLWAIGRILKYAALEDIRRLLTVEDIADALPYTDLPEQKRKVLERALEIWRHGT